jgi:hypothetical protein
MLQLRNRDYKLMIRACKSNVLQTTCFFSKESLLFIVIRRSKNIISVGVLAAYVIISLVGYFQLLGGFINSGPKPYKITDAKKSHPFESRPYFIQTKHVVPFTKVEVPTESLISKDQFPNQEDIKWFYSNPTFSSYVSYKYTRYLPRDPPTA